MKKRSDFKPTLSSLWKPGTKKDHFTADPIALHASIEQTGRSDSDLKRVIGAAWNELETLRSGQGEVGFWTAYHLDYALNGAPPSL